MKERIQSKIKKFTDFTGAERTFVIVGVSRIVDNIKILSIGLSICHPDDEFDTNIGFKVAYQKAINSKNNLVIKTPSFGMVNTKMVDLILDQQADYFINNPESYLKGYKEAKKKYEKRIAKENKRKELLNSMNAATLDIIHYLNNLDNDSRRKILSCISE